MTVNQFLEILKTYDGVFGAVLGSISTLIVTHILKNMGKVSIKIRNMKVEYFKSDNYGGRQRVDKFCENGYADIRIFLDIYNSANNNKTINDIQYKLLDDTKKVIHIGEMSDFETGKVSAGALKFEKFTFLNCNPKELVKKDLHVSFEPSNILLLGIAKKLVIEGKIEGRKLPVRKNIKIIIDL